ncbi:MAG: GntR family transcriptional regulator [Ideonella sp.]|nr:GntR family transcriptional regulator [Ideonella sp.]
MDTPARTAPSLARRALYEDVADRLREQIFARRLEPGSWIDEQALAAEFGISRTPLREALKVLAVEGLVTMKVRRGAYVTEMSVDDVTEVFHLLAVLESDAAGEVARRASATQLAELQRLHDELEQLEVAGNRWRAQIVADLRKVMKLNRHHSLFRRGRLSDSLAEHRRSPLSPGA